MRLTFGKYRGKPIADVPTSYLEWVLDECDAVEPMLRRAIYAEVARRRDWRGEKDEDEPAGVMVHPGVLKWRESWRRIIFLAHPDRGGNEELCRLLVGLNETMKAG